MAQLGDITFSLKTVNKTAEAVNKASRGLDKMKSSARGLEGAQRAGARATKAASQNTTQQAAALQRAQLEAQQHKLQVDRLALSQQKLTLQQQRFAAQQARSKQAGGSLYNVLTRIPTAYFAIAGGAVGAFRALGQFTGAARQMNKEMANVGTLIPGNRARLDSLKGTVQDLAVKLGTGTGNLTQGLYDTVSAFGDSADTAKILEIQAKAARAGVATVADALSLTSAVTKGYGDTSAEANQKAADLAFTTVKLGQTNFPQLAASIGRVVPLASELKVSQEELFGVFATATGVTGNASEVATQYRGVLQSLLSPTASMTGLYEKLGVESGKALIEQRGFPGALKAIVGAANESGTPLQKYIGSIEGQTLALSLTGAQADTYLEKSRAMVDTTGALDEAFRAQTEGIDSAGASWDRITSKWDVTKQKIGDALLPAIESLEPAINSVLDGLVRFTSDLGTMIASVGDAASGNMSLTDSFKQLLHVGAGIPAELLGIQDAMDDTTESAAALSDELAGHSVTTSFDKAREKGEKFLRMVREIPQYVGRAVNDIGRLGAVGGNFIREQGDGLGFDFGAAFNAGFLRGVQPFHGNLTNIVGGISTLPTFAESGLGGGRSWLGGFFDQLTGQGGDGGFMSRLGGFMQTVQGGWQGIATTALNMVPVVGPILSAFGPVFMQGLGALGGKLKGWLGNLFGGPNQAQLDARETGNAYIDALGESLNQDQIAEAMAAGWEDPRLAKAHIAMRDLAIQAGLSIAEAENLSKRYFDAMRAGDADTMRAIENQVNGWRDVGASATEAAESAKPAWKELSDSMVDNLVSAYNSINEKAREAGRVAEEQALKKGDSAEVAAKKGEQAAEREYKKQKRIRIRTMQEEAALAAAVKAVKEGNLKGAREAAEKAYRQTGRAARAAFDVIEQASDIARDASGKNEEKKTRKAGREMKKRERIAKREADDVKKKTEGITRKWVTEGDKITLDWEATVKSVNEATNGLKDRTVRINVQHHTTYTYSGSSGSAGGVSGEDVLPKLATGGIVTRPLVAQVAEREPEAVIPLSKLKSILGGSRTMIVRTEAGRELLRFIYDEGADVGDWVGVDR